MLELSGEDLQIEKMNELYNCQLDIYLKRRKRKEI
jgi:hypothetical protein